MQNTEDAVMTQLKRTETMEAQNCFSKIPMDHRRSRKVAEHGFSHQKGSEEKTESARENWLETPWNEKLKLNLL